MEIETKAPSTDIGTATEETQKRGQQVNSSAPSPNHSASKLLRSANATDAKYNKTTNKEEIRVETEEHLGSGSNGTPAKEAGGGAWTQVARNRRNEREKNGQGGSGGRAGGRGRGKEAGGKGDGTQTRAPRTFQQKATDRQKSLDTLRMARNFLRGARTKPVSTQLDSDSDEDKPDANILTQDTVAEDPPASQGKQDLQKKATPPKCTPRNSYW